MKLTLIVFVSLFAIVHSLRCYTCERNQPHCQKGDSRDYLKKCRAKNGNEPKYCIKSSYVATGKTNYYRGCGYGSRVNSNYCNQTKDGRDNVLFCTCNKDKCNDASYLSVNTLVIPCLALISLIVANTFTR